MCIYIHYIHLPPLEVPFGETQLSSSSIMLPLSPPPSPIPLPCPRTNFSVRSVPWSSFKSVESNHSAEEGLHDGSSE